MLSREMPMARLHPPVQELEEIARALAEAEACARQAPCAPRRKVRPVPPSLTALEIAYRTATRGEWEWDLLESGE